MEALSINSGYAMLIAIGDKKEEYRTWRPKRELPFDLLICANRERGQYRIPGHALCVVSITDVYRKDDVWAWKIENVRPIKPFPVKGKLHIFDVPTTKKMLTPIDLEDDDDFDKYYLPLQIIPKDAKDY